MQNPSMKLKEIEGPTLFQTIFLHFARWQGSSSCIRMGQGKIVIFVQKKLAHLGGKPFFRFKDLWKKGHSSTFESWGIDRPQSPLVTPFKEKKHGPVKLGKKKQQLFWGPSFCEIRFLDSPFLRCASSQGRSQEPCPAEPTTSGARYVMDTTRLLSVVFNDKMIPSWWVHDFN